MSAEDAGYDFIYNYSDKEVHELYTYRINHAKKCLKESELEEALAYIEDAAYYSGILRDRGYMHKALDYDSLSKDLCNRLYGLLGGDEDEKRNKKEPA